MESCTFYHRDRAHVMTFDNALVQTIRTREITGPRNPYKSRLLGKIGEFLAPILLEGIGFTSIKDLNRGTPNHKDADFLAERGGLFFISVKARNKWQRAKTLNDSYKLETKSRKVGDAQKNAETYNAEFAWLAIQLDREVYSAYYGTHSQLCSTCFRRSRLGNMLSGRAIKMNPEYTKLYEPLAVNEHHTLPYELISNQA